MPQPPRTGSETITIGQQPVKLVYYALLQEGTEYAVISLSGLQNNMGDLAHMLMLNLYNERINKSLADSGDGQAMIKATYQRDVELNGYRGREYSIVARNTSGVWRFYRVGEKFYAVAASAAQPDNVSVKRFFSSFALGPTAVASVETDESESTPRMEREAAPIKQSQTAHRVPRSRSETWLIILNTFSKSETSRAWQRVSQVRSLGYDAHVLTTDDYPNLRKGFLAVAIGPHSRSTAEDLLNKVRSIAPGSYIKPGW